MLLKQIALVLLFAISFFEEIKASPLEIAQKNERENQEPITDHSLIPTMKTPLPDSVDFSILQDVINPSVQNPTAKRVAQFIKSFNNIQQSFDRIVNLAKPFLSDNEMKPLRNKAKNNFARQALEIRWLLKVAGHKKKMVKLYELLSIVRNKLKLGFEVTPGKLEDVQEREDDLVDSEVNLKMKTHDFIRYVVLS